MTLPIERIDCGDCAGCEAQAMVMRFVDELNAFWIGRIKGVRDASPFRVDTEPLERQWCEERWRLVQACQRYLYGCFRPMFKMPAVRVTEVR